MAPGSRDQHALTGVEVLVVGAGPVGLVLALEAHRHGARAGVIERRSSLERPSRAMLLWPRTLQALDRLGVADGLEVLPAARLAARLHLGSREVQVSLARLVAPRSDSPPLMVRQADLEAVLHHAVEERGIPLLTATELTLLRIEDRGAVARLSTHETGATEVRCRFVVGCDGADSTVRRLAAIPWQGHTYPQEAVLADLHVDDLEPSIAHIGAGRAGIGFLFPAGEHGATWRLVATRVSRGAQTPPGTDGPPLPIHDLRSVLEGANLPGRITEAAWSTRVRLQLRRAGRYQSGPVFLAGDAAHVFSPAGAQGMNTGIQDASNLGWKLAAALRGSSDPQVLLASYETERMPVARQVGILTDLLLHGEGDERLPYRLTRTRLLPAVAPAVPGLLRVPALTELAGWVLSQGWVCSARGPVTHRQIQRPHVFLRPGCPAPARQLTVDGERLSMRELTRAPGVHVFHGCGVTAGMCDVPGVRTHEVHDWLPTRVLAVRPDGVIGYRDDAGRREPLLRWLRLVTAVEPRWRATLDERR